MISRAYHELLKRSFGSVRGRTRRPICCVVSTLCRPHCEAPVRGSYASQSSLHEKVLASGVLCPPDRVVRLCTSCNKMGACVGLQESLRSKNGENRGLSHLHTGHSDRGGQILYRRQLPRPGTATKTLHNTPVILWERNRADKPSNNCSQIEHPIMR